MKRAWTALVAAGCLAVAASALAQDAPAEPKPEGEDFVGPEEPAPEPPKPPAARDASATQKAILARKLSVDLRGTPLHDTLEMLAAEAGVGLSVDGHITGEKLREPVDLHLRKGSVYAVLHWMFLKRDLDWAINGKEIVVAPLRFLDPDVANRQNEFIQRTEDDWEAKTRPRLSETKMTVDVSEVPLEGIMDILADRVELSVVWAGEAEKSRSRQVSLNLADAPVAQILDKLTEATGLEWSLEAEAIVISPR